MLVNNCGMSLPHHFPIHPPLHLRHGVTSDYNDPFQIVDVNLTSEGKTKIEVGMTLTFTYQVCSLGKGSFFIQDVYMLTGVCGWDKLSYGP